jgi:hypothetical protein
VLYIFWNALGHFFLRYPLGIMEKNEKRSSILHHITPSGDHITRIRDRARHSWGTPPKTLNSVFWVPTSLQGIYTMACRTSPAVVVLDRREFSWTWIVSLECRDPSLLVEQDHDDLLLYKTSPSPTSSLPFSSHSSSLHFSLLLLLLLPPLSQLIISAAVAAELHGRSASRRTYVGNLLSESSWSSV